MNLKIFQHFADGGEEGLRTVNITFNFETDPETFPDGGGESASCLYLYLYRQSTTVTFPDGGGESAWCACGLLAGRPDAARGEQ